MALFNMDMVLNDMDDPLHNHPRYEKIRMATCMKSNVQIALDREKNRNVAIKSFRRGADITDDVRREILHHAELHHINVVALYHVFLTSSHLCVAMELGSQSLWQYVHAKGGRLPEEEAHSIFIQLIEGVHYCHSQGVANRSVPLLSLLSLIGDDCRDIKLENCLVFPVYRNGKCYTILKICDFGYCKNVETDSVPDSLVGTAAYVCMDLLDQDGSGYDAKLVDIWSCGVVLYYLIRGRFPFGTEENGGRAALWHRILALEYEMSSDLGYGVQDLLSQIFCPSALRIDMNRIRDHWWVRQGYKRDDMRQMKSMHLESDVTQGEKQSPVELKHLIAEARIRMVDQDDMGDEYLP